MGKEVLIRLAENDRDLLDVARLKAENSSKELDLEEILNFRNRGYNFWIAKEGQIPVGYSMGIIKGESYSSEGVYVISERRKNEIGPKLKLAQINYARSLGCDEIWSLVNRYNEASKRMQEKIGFKRESIEKTQLLRFVISLRD